MMQTLADRLAALAAKPKTHRVLTKLADGRVETLDCMSQKSADSFAEFQRRKLGRELIDRETGEKVVITAVTVERIG